MAKPQSFVPKSALIVFNRASSVKLDNENHILWKQQVIAAIRSHHLFHFLDGSRSNPLQYLSSQDRVSEQVNPAFLDWEQQDQLLVSWLFSSMIETLLTHLVGCETAL